MTLRTNQRARARRGLKRTRRGAIMLEYVVLLTCVVLPCLAGAVLCYVNVHSWYLRFVDRVSAPNP